MKIPELSITCLRSVIFSISRWKLTADHLAKSAKAKLYNVLLFPDGWIVGADEEEYLRSTCIPEVVLLLYAVLSESGHHEEAVQLSDLVASEKYGIYKVSADYLMTFT